MYCVSTVVKCIHNVSLMPCPDIPPDEKQSGETSQISWAYYQKVVRNDKIG